MICRHTGEKHHWPSGTRLFLHELQLCNKQPAVVFVAVAKSECVSMTGSSRATGMRNVVFVVPYLYPVSSGLEIRVGRSVQLNQIFPFFREFSGSVH